MNHLFFCRHWPLRSIINLRTEEFLRKYERGTESCCLVLGLVSAWESAEKTFQNGCTAEALLIFTQILRHYPERERKKNYYSQ